MANNIILKFSSYLLLIAVLFFAAVEVSAQSKKDIRKATQLAQEGDNSFQRKDYRGAISKYAESIVIMPNNAKAHFWKGYAHYYLKENGQAMTELDLALSKGFSPLEIYKLRWFLHYDNKNLDAALADIKQGLQLEPNNLMFLVGLAEISDTKGQYKESLDAYQRAVLIEPNNAELYYNIARVQFNLNNAQGQAAAAEEAIKRNTRFLGESYYLLGDAYQKLKRPNEAGDAYARAISAKPDIYQAYRNLAEIYRSESKFNDAIDVLKKAKNQFPNDGNIYTDLSWYYSLADRNDEAIQAAKAGIQLLPKQQLAYTNLCRAYNDAKQYQLAISACNEALRITPNDGETNFYLGRAYDFLDKPAEATKYYDRAVTGLVEFTRNNPDYSDGYYLLGNAYHADNQRDKAIEAYTKCLQLNPRFGKARFNLGYMYVLKKNKSAAMEQYNSLLSMDQNLAAKLKAEIDKL